MALTRDSCLFYFDAAYGIAPVVGGAPEFDRESGAYFQDARGQFRGPVPIDTPIRERILVGSEYRTALRLEPAATNLIPRNRQRFAGWTAYEGAVVTLTQGQTIPGWTPDGAATRIQTAGGTSAIKLYWEGAVRGVANEAVSVVIQNNGATAVTVSPYGGGASVSVQPGETKWVQTATAAANPALTSRLRFQAPAAGDSLDFLAYAPAVVLQPYCSSLVYDPDDTDGAVVTRAASVCAFRAPPVPQAMAGYCEFVAGMDANGGITDARVWQIGAAANTNPRLFLRHDAAAMTLRIYDAAGANVVASPAAAPTTGQRVRVGWALRADASLYAVVQLDDDAPVAGGPSAALASGIPTAWSSPARLSLSGVGTLVRGRHYHLRHHIVTLADMTNQPGVATAADFLAELEDYYLDPAGNLI